MSKLDDKDLTDVAAGGGIVDAAPDGPGDGEGADTIENNAPPEGGGIGLDDQGSSGGTSDVGQG